MIRFSLWDHSLASSMGIQVRVIDEASMKFDYLLKKLSALWFCVLLLMISPRPFTQPTAATMPGKKYLCDCSQYCKGRQTEVHRNTYRRHAPVRQADLEQRLARCRRDRSLVSARPLLEEGSRSTNLNLNRTSGARENVMEIANGDSEPQVRHAAQSIVL